MKKEPTQRYFNFALITTVATYVLIFIGGLVRVSGAGLGCPDWPKCFGRWIPPTDVSQLPVHIDPNMFNFTLAWIEYINRLCGVIVGLLILVTAILAVVYMRRYHSVLVSAVGALILVAIQGWQGGQVVASALNSAVVTVHMLLAFVIVTLLLYSTLKTYFLQHPEARQTQARSYSAWIAILYVITLIQVLLGTQIRSELEGMQENMPLLTVMEWIGRLGPVHNVHIILGLVTLIGTVLLTLRFYSRGFMNNRLFAGSVWALNGLNVLQIGVGFILLALGLPPLMQAIHLWLASFIVGVLMMIYTSAR